MSGLAAAVRGFAPGLPGPWGGIVGGVASAVSLVADLIAAGRDPVTEIERIRALDWRKADDEVDAELRRRMGES